VLLWKGIDQGLYMSFYDAATGFTAASAMRSSLGMVLTTSAIFTSPAALQTYVPGVGSDVLLALLPDAGGVTWAYAYRPDTQDFEMLPSFTSGVDVHGRPSLASVPLGTGSSLLRERMYMVYATRPSNPTGFHNRAMRMRMSHVPAGSRSAELGLDSSFDNGWYFANSVDLLYERSDDGDALNDDTNLRAALTMGTQNAYQKLVFRPKADAIHDYNLVNYNDWPNLAHYLCMRTTSPDPASPPATAVNCPSYF
jgi:hypothetical protein